MRLVSRRDVVLENLAKPSKECFDVLAQKTGRSPVWLRGTLFEPRLRDPSDLVAYHPTGDERSQQDKAGNVRGAGHGGAVPDCAC